MADHRLARLSLLAAAVAGILACSPARYVPKANEEYYGTWVSETFHPQKVVLFADGTFEEYLYPADDSPYYKGTFEIKSKRVEKDGTIWYKSLMIPSNTFYKGRKILELCRITQAGRSRESITEEVREYDAKLFPPEMDPKSTWYRAHTRVD